MAKDKLTDTVINNYRPRDKPFKISDGGGMFLLIKPNGTRLWRLKYRIQGKEKLMALGKYPEVSLAQARGKRELAREKISQQIDPLQLQREEKLRAEEEEKRIKANSFVMIAEEWLSKMEAKWKPSHTHKVRRSLEIHVFPFIGQKPITQIESSELLDMLRGVQERGTPEVANRVLQRLSRIFQMGIILGVSKRNPAAHLQGVLPSPRHNHYKSLKESELSEFIKRLDTYDGKKLTRLALEMIIHTALRTTELRLAEWSEFETESEQPIWRIPGDRMKMKDLHLVPLSRQVIVLLEQIREISGDGKLLFPSEKNPNQAMSYNTMLFALYRMGYHSRITVHGFRSLFSTYANEKGRFRPDVIERQLAHAPRDKVRGAYNHAEYLEERRELLQWWSDHLENFRTPGKVIDFQSRKAG